MFPRFTTSILLIIGPLVMLSTAGKLETNKKDFEVSTPDKSIRNKIPLRLSKLMMRHLRELRELPFHENDKKVAELEAFSLPGRLHGKSRERHREREEEKERERMEANGRKERERERMRQRERERMRAGQDGRLVKELEKETEGERQRQRLSSNGRLQMERQRFRYRARGEEAGTSELKN